MGGIELLGTVCALWGNISQECSSAASQHCLAGNFASGSKAFEGFEGIRELAREFAMAAAAAWCEAVAKGLLWIWLCRAKSSHH